MQVTADVFQISCTMHTTIDPYTFQSSNWRAGRMLLGTPHGTTTITQMSDPLPVTEETSKDSEVLKQKKTRIKVTTRRPVLTVKF